MNEPHLESVKRTRDFRSLEPQMSRGNLVVTLLKISKQANKQTNEMPTYVFEICNHFKQHRRLFRRTVPTAADTKFIWLCSENTS